MALMLVMSIAVSGCDASSGNCDSLLLRLQGEMRQMVSNSEAEQAMNQLFADGQMSFDEMKPKVDAFRDQSVAWTKGVEQLIDECGMDAWSELMATPR